MHSLVRRKGTGAPRPVLLLALDWTRDKDPRVPLGHASILANLRQTAGVAVSAREFSINDPRFDVERVLAEILTWERGLDARSYDLAIGVYVWNERHVQRLLLLLREHGFGGRIILGGPQISYAPPGVQALYPHADGFVRGYGESALAAVASSDHPLAAAGVVWRGGLDTEGRAEADLDSLPSPLLTGAIPLDGQRYLRWETQRGCPYRCNFCQHRESGARLRLKYLPLARLRDEIALFARHDIRELDVLDPIFNVGPHQIPILDELARHHVGARISLQCRFELVDPAFLDFCGRLDLHPEFGLQTIHEAEWQVIERNNKMDRVEAAMSELARRGVPYMVTLIYGLPDQTLASFRATVSFCLERRVPIIRAFPLNLLRGTELERTRDRWQLVESDDPIPMVVRSTTFDERDWREMRRLADALAATEGRHPPGIAGLT